MTGVNLVRGFESLPLRSPPAARYSAPIGALSSTLDEIHLIPILLGDGRPQFARLGADHVELEPTRVVDTPGVTHLRYEVRS